MTIPRVFTINTYAHILYTVTVNETDGRGDYTVGGMDGVAERGCGGGGGCWTFNYIIRAKNPLRPLLLRRFFLILFWPRVGYFSEQARPTTRRRRFYGVGTKLWRLLTPLI